MNNMSTRLQIGDVFAVDTQEFYGLKRGKYKVVKVGKTRKGALTYEVTYDRKNASTMYSVYVDDIDRELHEPSIEELTTSIGLTFLNFKSVIKYDKNLIAEAKKINSQK